jgi:hypothetical protein
LHIPRDIFMAATITITLLTGFDYFKKALHSERQP